jgi:hypothetical protein
MAVVEEFGILEKKKKKKKNGKNGKNRTSGFRMA